MEPVDPDLLIGALEHAPSGIAVLTDGGGIEWANARLSRIFRCDRERVVGLSLGELMHPDDFEPSELTVDGLRPGRVRDCGRKRIRRPDGSFVWIGLTLSAYGRPRDDAAAPSLIVANVFDLTELVRAEERLASVVEGLDDGVVSVDPQGRIAAANPAAERMLEPLGADLVGINLRQPPWDVVDEDGNAIAPDARPELAALASGETVFATIGLRRHGEECWVDVAAHCLDRSGSRWVAATYKDVSERLRIEAALREAEAAGRAKSAFLSRMSHELRTPLNSVLGFAQILQLDELPPRQLESVEQILKAGQHLLGLLNEVLDLERIQSGHLEVQLRPTEAMTAVQDAVEFVRPLADASGISIDVQCEHPEPVYVLADEQRLRQVLLNLLTNGVKFNRAEGHITVSCHVLHQMIVIRVRDTGPGISRSDIDQVFLPFERLDADRRGIEGAGVGLALAKQLTEAMGGAIGVESDVGFGTTFYVALRTTDLEAGAVRPQPLVHERLNDVLKTTGPTRRRVLYIEDNAASRTLMERIAARHGSLDLTTASTAREGLDRARAMKPDAILLDLHLPDAPGDDVLKALKRDPATRATPVIVLTADATPERRGPLTAAGAAGHLTKPVDLFELYTALEVVFAAHR